MVSCLIKPNWFPDKPDKATLGSPDLADLLANLRGLLIKMLDDL